jgi:hypothetical protein
VVVRSLQVFGRSLAASERVNTLAVDPPDSVDLAFESIRDVVLSRIRIPLEGWVGNISLAVPVTKTMAGNVKSACTV